MSDFADFVLGCWPAVVEVIAVLAIALALIQAARLTLHLAAAGRERRRRQAAVLRLRRSAAMQRTRPMDLGGLVIDPGAHWDDDAVARFRDAWRDSWAGSAVTEVIDPDPALGCTWCRPGTLHAWPCQCAADCGDPACLPGVRHG